ncbi:hypothetical protein H1230_15960 [Paenibacillus sp. 19GGS1-52]|uniref:hypothetical protein n=1 Tax=Paenibacillus sp. 19GGS1-52 TaxID=2758563 RepID=UPI001EFB6B0C|nr:hypothetical protein [Paenibacillus sp. 19GGS1-52]ULO10650.1 hypothetical protein H1230_15960 [Paenibacillus sp. 19GGS1-52]
MIKDPSSKEMDMVETERTDDQKPTDSSIFASNAIKYTAFVMLLFGFLYFVIEYLAPML